MEGGGLAAARPAIVRKEIGGALASNRGHLSFNIVDLFPMIFEASKNAEMKIHYFSVTGKNPATNLSARMEGT